MDFTRLFRRRPSPTAMTWVVAGLGNPGAKYDRTRHNVGRDAARRLAERNGIRLDSTKFSAMYGQGNVGGERVCIALPLKYMNENGQAIVPLARFYKVPPERVLAIFDDLDLPLGTLRLRMSGGSGGNRGVASLIRQLGTEDFPRIRIGIGRPPDGWEAADYVLSRFTDDEREVVDTTIDDATRAAEKVIAEGIESAMNAFN